MWDKLQGMSEQDWVWIGTVTGSLLIGIFAAVKGMKRTPSEVGTSLPLTGQFAEGFAGISEIRPLVREINRKADRLEEMLEDQERQLSRVYVDTQIMRERKS